MPEAHVHVAGGAVPVLLDPELGLALEVLVVVLDELFAKDEEDQIGVLLDGAALSEIGEARLELV